MRIGAIWAQASHRAIGRNGVMPWHLPEDLAHFRRVTVNTPVVMGRRTWESLPERFRPLPGRTNIVVTRDRNFAAPGAQCVGSVDEALQHVAAKGDPTTAGAAAGVDVWVIGGGQLYAEVLPFAHELVITHIDTVIDDADTFAPELSSRWCFIETSEEFTSKSGMRYRFERWSSRTEG